MARVVRRTYLGGAAAVVGGLLAAACGEVEIRYVQGPAGPAGAAGAQGARGAAGAAGAKGAAGAAGQSQTVVQEKVVTVEKPVVVEKVVEKVVERASSRLVAWTGPTIGSVGPGADLWTKLDALFADMHPEIQLTRSRPARPKGKSNDDVLIAAAAAGIAPDVYSVNVTAWQQARLVELGLPLALDRYYAQKPNLNRIYRWMREQARFNGRLYGVPHEMEFIAFWYNAKVFEKHGLEIPSTWEELLKAAQTLLSAKVMPIAEQAHWNYGHLYSLTLAAIGGKGIVDDIVAGNKRWDSADPIKAAEVILDLQRRGYLPPNPTDEGDPAYPMGASFVSGKVGMWATGTWSVGWMQQQANESQGEFAFEFSGMPSPTGTQPLESNLAGGSGGGHSVWSQSRLPEQAVTFLDFLFAPEPQKAWIETTFQIPPVPFRVGDYNISPGQRRALEIIHDARETGFGWSLDVILPSKVHAAFWPGVMGVLRQEITPKEMMARIQQLWEVR
jgi:raffinose/stachyose/melibiose transport system substrate-binding protein